jgi:glycosyltransferase involved in cell wall biosynthesis
VRCSERGKSQALNEGLRHATGSVVCFLDDDVTVDSSYFVELFAGLKRWPGAAGFGGRVKPEFPSDAPTLHPLALSYVRGFAYAAHDFLEGEGEYPSGSRPCGNNMAFRRGWLEGEVFDTSTGPGAAGYRMGSGERLFRGILARGGKLVHLPLVRVNHHVRPDQLTTRWLLTRSYSYGRSLGYHGFAHHGISGAAPTLHLLGTWLVRVCRELAFGLLGKSYPRLWAQIDRKLVEGILAERLAPSTRR